MEWLNVLSGSATAAQILLSVLLFPIVGCICVWLISLHGQSIPGNSWRNWRDVAIWTSCGLTLAGLIGLQPFWGTEILLPGMGGPGYRFGIDGLRFTLAVLAALLWLLSSLFSRWYLSQSGHKMRYYCFFLLGESGILTVLLSADLYTMLTGFVLLNLCSWVLIGHRETAPARSAARRALFGLVAGSLAALLGVFLLTSLLGTVRFSALQVLGPACDHRLLLYLAGALMLGGISLSCSFIPWPRRTPGSTAAPGPAAALLAGAVTVAWLFSAMVLSGLLFWWDSLWGLFLCGLGTALLVFAAVGALMSKNLKQTLSWLAVSQTGPILLALGLNCLAASQNQVPAATIILQALHHGLCQLLLFLCAGTVCMHQSDLSLAKVCGFGRGKKVLFLALSLGGASLCGIPLFFGSVTQTLLQTALRQHMAALPLHGRGWWAFAGISVLVILSCGVAFAAVLKLLVCLYARPNASAVLQEHYNTLSGRWLSPMVRVLLPLLGVVLLVAGVAAPVVLQPIVSACAGFFSTAASAPVTVFRWQVFALGGMHLVIGGVLYLIFWHKRLAKLAQPAPDAE